LTLALAPTCTELAICKCVTVRNLPAAACREMIFRPHDAYDIAKAQAGRQVGRSGEYHGTMLPKARAATCSFAACILTLCELPAPLAPRAVGDNNERFWGAVAAWRAPGGHLRAYGRRHTSFDGTVRHSAAAPHHLPETSWHIYQSGRGSGAQSWACRLASSGAPKSCPPQTCPAALTVAQSCLRRSQRLDTNLI
jgi:hypothetical protein